MFINRYECSTAVSTVGNFDLILGKYTKTFLYSRISIYQSSGTAG